MDDAGAGAEVAAVVAVAVGADKAPAEVVLRLVNERVFPNACLLAAGRPRTRLFPDSGPDGALELVESQATPGGVTIQVYRPTGPLQYGTSTADLKHMT